MGRLDGVRAVITGAASGIGEATARLFAAEGAAVVLADIDDDRGEKIAGEAGDRCRYVHADVSQDGAIDAAVAAATDTFGGLDCLFNNAGTPGSVAGGIEEADLAVFDRTVAVHLRGTFLGIRAAARVMRPHGRGSIINTASVAGLAAGWGGHDYSACKAAVIQLTRTAASELGEDGIRVNAICPGAIATPIFGRAAGLGSQQASATIELITAALADLAPIRRAGQPADIAEAALWLASDASAYVNGQAIAVDGGPLTGRCAASSARPWTCCSTCSGKQPSNPLPNIRATRRQPPGLPAAPARGRLQRGRSRRGNSRRKEQSHVSRREQGARPPSRRGGLEQGPSCRLR